MKLRKPRWGEATLLTSFPACQFSHGTISAAGVAGSCAATLSVHAAPRSAAATRAGLCMESDSRGHGLDAIPARIPGHQQKKGEIADGKHARGSDVAPDRRSQTQPHQRTEGNGKGGQKAAEPPAAVAYRPAGRALHPRQDEQY